MSTNTNTPKGFIDEILKVEGERYTNDPKDSGGPTKWGVTQAAYSTYLKRPVSAAEIQNLTREKAFDFYWNKHYIKPGLDSVYTLCPPVCQEVMDTGVNMGETRAGEFLQRCLNFFNINGTLYPDVVVDGHLGPASMTALKGYLKARPGTEGVLVLVEALNSLQGAFYINLAESRPKDERFSYGWFANRVLPRPKV